ncbi:MAG: sensor signal transduction histidine kinase [Bacteroidota bacterium]|nr:sensor signal transduction histidine kinase [Bacteroidota bacterium]
MAEVKEHIKNSADWHDKLDLHYLPAYADFLLQNKLEEFNSAMLRISREVEIPLLKLLALMPEEQLLELSLQGTKELLEYFSQNKMATFIEISLKRWIENEIQVIQSDQVEARDISSVSFVRRKIFRDFFPQYSSDLTLYRNVMEEVDRFTVEFEEHCYNTLFEIKQQKINEHNQDLREAQEIAGMGSFDWDLEGKDSNLSKQLLNIFELEGPSSMNSFLEYVHPGDRKKVREAIEKATKGDGVYESEYRYRKNNKEKVIWSRGLVTFKDGKALRMKGTVMDITERHHMLQRLERSEELHKQAQALTHLGNWSWFIEDSKINWSDEMYRIYGLEPQSEEITFERFQSLIHPEDRENRLKEIQKALETLRADDYEMRIVTPHGEEKVLQGKGEVLVDEENKPYKIVGTCQDVTKQFHLNQQVKENEETFRQLINNAPDAVVVIDENSTILLWNPKAEEVFGWNEKEIIGKTLTETIIPPTYRSAHLEGIHRLHTTGEARVLNKSIEISAINKSGNEFFIALSISRSVRAGKPVFISFIRDITNEKKAEMEIARHRNELTQKNIELELSNQQLTSFNYIASHDLQEPLRKIRIYSNRILEKNMDVLPGDTMDFLQRIMTSAAHMQNLIEDLLAFSRATATDQIFDTVDLNILFEEIKANLKHVIEEKKVSIAHDILPSMRLIPFQFEQLLENIINNSIKYSYPDIPPVINIISDIVKGGEYVKEGASPHQDYHRISIKDNGIGFDEAYASKIFELFQRLHGKSEYSGTGIGLAICKKIVENHKGFITANSVEGKGATFSIFIPVT